jgi:uncharacterized membrane protein YraQ (UPF0718 family)
VVEAVTLLTGTSFDGLGLLIASLTALAIAPVLSGLAQRGKKAMAVLDGFVFVAIGGLVVGHVLPECVHVAGGWTLLVALVGLVGPLLMERSLGNAARHVHNTALVLAIIGIFMHGILDGMTLGMPDLASHAGHASEASVSLLPLAVVLHRIPVGITVWWLLKGPYGSRVAAAVLIVIAVGTVGGYVAADGIVAVTESTWIGYFQALVAGSLLHVMVHRTHPVSGENSGWQAASGLGAVAGLAVIMWVSGWFEPEQWSTLISEHGHDHSWVSVLMDLAIQSAPALILAYIASGLIHAFLPGASINWLSKGRPSTQAFRGVVFGLPLPMCSCGVIPVYRTLVLKGVPATAAMAFFVATPELGLDAIFLSIPLLGAKMTVARVVCAVTVALLVGWFVGRMAARSRTADSETHVEQAASATGFLGRLREAVRVGLGDVVDATIPWIVLGLVIAAAIDPLLRNHADNLIHVPELVQITLLALLGMPVYVCASGATPLVAVLVAHGISPGAAIAFLMTGPATNVTTFGILSSLHSRRVAVVFGATIAITSIGLGWIVNRLLPNIDMGAIVGGAHATSPIETWALLGLGLLVLISIFRQGPRHFVDQVLPVAAHSHDHSDDHTHDDHTHDDPVHSSH